MDGIDAALVELPGNKLLCGITKKYSDGLKNRIEQAMTGSIHGLSSLCQLNTLIGKEFALAVLELLAKAKTAPEAIVAIGSHGQTLAHDTSGEIPYTLQLGCAHTISALTGITVVADFRTRDIVNGGQGAPLAPLYHQEIFANTKDHIAVVNIGGIANVTFITSKQKTQGWDVGPGNCLMDAWINKHQQKNFDEDGAWAMEGEVINPLLDKLLSDPFFALAATKSIGKEYFSLAWLETHLKKEYKAVDVQATLTALTAYSIANTVAIKNNSSHLYLCGGGTHNRLLHKKLVDLLPHTTVLSITSVGLDPDYLEAMMFAWLASQTLNNIPVDLTAITGSTDIAILGAIYPAINHKRPY